MRALRPSSSPLSPWSRSRGRPSPIRSMTLARAIEAHPDDAKAYDAYALAAFKTKRYDDAIHELKIGVARIPDYGEGYYKLAYAFRQKSEWADAADYYRRYIALHPDEDRSLFRARRVARGARRQEGRDRRLPEVRRAREVAGQAALRRPRRKTELARARGRAHAGDRERARAGSRRRRRRIRRRARLRRLTPSATAPRADAADLARDADQLRQTGKLDEAAGAYKNAIEADRGKRRPLQRSRQRLLRAQAVRRRGAGVSRRDAPAIPNYALGWYNLAHALRKGDQRARPPTRIASTSSSSPTIPILIMASARRSRRWATCRARSTPSVVHRDGEAARRAALGRQGARRAARCSRRCSSSQPARRRGRSSKARRRASTASGGAGRARAGRRADAVRLPRRRARSHARAARSVRLATAI